MTFRRVWRYWLKGEWDETDKGGLAINLYNARRRVDPRLKGAPRGERMTRGNLRHSPEILMVEIFEAFAVLTSWAIVPNEALARIEKYRAQHFGSDDDGQRRSDLKSYLHYRLSIESRDWPDSPTLAASLIESGVDRCMRFFAKYPPALVVTPGFGSITTITRASLLAPVDDISSERIAVDQHEQNAIDHLCMYLLNGDRMWRFLDNSHGAHWVRQGYALVRGGEIAKAVVSSVSEYDFGPVREV